MICKSKWIVTAVFLFSILMLEPAFAIGSMRCGTHIISVGGRSGPSQYEVLKKCGAPKDRAGNIWTYEQPGGATRVVVFNASGTVTRID